MYLNFKAVLALPKTAGSAQTHKSISFIWIVWRTPCVYLCFFGKKNWIPDINAATVSHRLIWQKKCIETHQHRMHLYTMFHTYEFEEENKYINIYIFVPKPKVIYTKYSKHCPSTVAHTIDCMCSKINHGLNHGFFLSLFKLILCPIHWIVCVLVCI